MRWWQRESTFYGFCTGMLIGCLLFGGLALSRMNSNSNLEANGILVQPAPQVTVSSTQVDTFATTVMKTPKQPLIVVRPAPTKPSAVKTPILVASTSPKSHSPASATSSPAPASTPSPSATPHHSVVLHLPLLPPIALG